MNKYGARIAACALMGSISLSGYQMTLDAKVNHKSTEVPAAGVAVILNEGSTIQELQMEVVQNIAYLESASGLQPNIKLASEKAAGAGVAVSAKNIKASAGKASTDTVQNLLSTAEDASNEENSESISEQDMPERDMPEQSSIEAAGQSEAESSQTEEGSSTSETQSASIEESETDTGKATEESSNVESSNAESSNAGETTKTTEESSNVESSNAEGSNAESSDVEDTGKVTEESPDAGNTEKTTEEGSDAEGTEKATEESSSVENSSEVEDDFQTSAGFSALDTYEDYETEQSTTEETELEEETEDVEETETQEEQDFSGLVIARVTNYVNVRSIPSEEGEIVGKLYDKSVGEFVEESNGWYKITSGNCTGYVKGEYCVVGEEAEALAKEVGTTYAIVNTTTLKVRKEASTESPVLGLVPIEEELVVVEELDGWVKIAIEEGDGYVSRDYVNLRTDFVHAESREEEEARLAKEAKAREEARAAAAARTQQANETAAANQVQKSVDNQATIAAAQTTAASSEGSAMGKEVINFATQFVGNPYVYGGSSLTNGTDCSGFVMSVYSNFGVSLPHSSSAMRSQGYDVGGLANAQPGDIVCYSGHVGLYVGNGQIVHASTSKTGIIVSNAGYRSVLAVRRIF